MPDLFNGFVEAIVEICHSLSLIARSIRNVLEIFLVPTPAYPRKGVDHPLQETGVLISISMDWFKKTVEPIFHGKTLVSCRFPSYQSIDCTYFILKEADVTTKYHHLEDEHYGDLR